MVDKRAMMTSSHRHIGWETTKETNKQGKGETRTNEKKATEFAESETDEGEEEGRRVMKYDLIHSIFA